MKIVALILTLFIFKAGTALPISHVEWEYIQISMDLENLEDAASDCCDADKDQGCCGSGMCCCISVGGVTMTFQDVSQPDIEPVPVYHKNVFTYSFLYYMNFHHAVFQPPRLV